MTQTTAPTKLRIAVLGCGRMGARHARNVAYFTPRAELVAVVDPSDKAQQWARENLPAGVDIYSNPEDALSRSDVDAVLISSITSQHAPLGIAAIKAGKHVLLEKPISIDVEGSRPFVELANAHPELKVMIGFSRRFDESYGDVYNRIQSGQLGKPYLIKSCTNDQWDPSGFFVAYSKASGGIFIDCGIHDIDISRWMFDVANPANLRNPNKQVTRVFATGQNVRHPELANDGDCDNALAVVEYENGSQCTFHLSRTAMHGHDCFAEIFGTEGKVVVNGNPAINRVEIRDKHGVRTESTPTYYERFREAFVREANTFAEVVLDNKPVPTTPDDALQAAQIAVALTHSFRQGKPVFFDDNGEPILD